MRGVLYGYSSSEEEMSLVSLEEGGEHADTSYEQPMWIHTADEVEFEMSRFDSTSDCMECLLLFQNQK